MKGGEQLTAVKKVGLGENFQISLEYPTEVEGVGKMATITHPREVHGDDIDNMGLIFEADSTSDKLDQGDLLIMYADLGSSLWASLSHTENDGDLQKVLFDNWHKTNPTETRQQFEERIEMFDRRTPLDDNTPQAKLKRDQLLNKTGIARSARPRPTSPLPTHGFAAKLGSFRIEVVA